MPEQHFEYRLNDLPQRANNLSLFCSFSLQEAKTVGSPFCSMWTMLPLSVSISCERFTMCTPVFSLGEDTPLTVFTLTPVSVDLTLSMEPVDAPADDFRDASLPRFSFLVRTTAPLFTLAFTAPTAEFTLLLLLAVLLFVIVLFTVVALFIVSAFSVVLAIFESFSITVGILSFGISLLAAILLLAEPLFTSIVSDSSGVFPSLCLDPRTF